MPPTRHVVMALLSLCCITSAVADGRFPSPSRYVPLAGAAAPAPAALKQESSAGALYAARLETPGLMVGEAPTERGPRAVLELQGGGVTGALGHPRLPASRRLVEVPRGAAVALDVDEGVCTTVSLKEWGLPDRLLPVQPPVPKVEGAVVPYVEDHLAYAKDELYPAAAAEIVDRAVIRGREVALVEIRPVRANPARGELRVCPSIGVRLVAEGAAVKANAEGAAAKENAEAARLASPQLDAALAGVVASTNETAAATSGPVGVGGATDEGAEGMLVIVHDSLVSALQPFVDWKRRTGFKVEVLKTSQIGVSPDDVAVKAAIQQRYQQWSHPSLGFVLLVGDSAYVPVHVGSAMGYSQPDENWYACVDGSDYLPDLAIARISTQTAAETTNVVNKLLMYERATFPTTAWLSKAGFVGTQEADYITTIETTHDYVNTTYYVPNGYQQTAYSHGAAASDRHYHSYGATRADISASINDGRGIVEYSGHGAESMWYGPGDNGSASYRQADVAANTNSGMYPFVVANACLTAHINYGSDVVGETWQKSANKGSVGYWGASDYSYWDEDDILERSFHQHLFSAAAPLAGQLTNLAKLDVYNHYGAADNVAYYYQIYTLLSEPSLSIWLGAPKAMSMTTTPSLAVGGTAFEATVTDGTNPIAGALVAVQRSSDHVLEAAYTDAAGHVALTLAPPPAATGTIAVTATRPGRRPVETTIPVDPAAGAVLGLDPAALDDSAGCDPDGYGDPGEWVVVRATLHNYGLTAATNVAATLSSTSKIYVTEAPLVVGTLAGGASQAINFHVQIGAVSCLDSATFTVAATGDGGLAASTSFQATLNRDFSETRTTETMEHAGAAPSGWTHGAGSGTDDWAIVATANNTQGGQYSFHCSDPDSTSEKWLATPAYTVVAPNPRFEVWHQIASEASWDGGRLEISTDGGANWNDVGSHFTEGGYDATLKGGALSGQQAWTGSTSFRRTVADLSSYVGQTVKLRFRFSSDDSVNVADGGWWIDDAAFVYGAGVGCDSHKCGVPTRDTAIASMTKGSGVTLVWRADPLAVRYKILRGADATKKASFVDVTAQDADPTDTTFTDNAAGNFAAYLVVVVGPDGDGPWGAFAP
ncbi:C25 family cysteine peptidase [bacterium]|nr:C25 family cysteine peptidase [bacterium]